MKKLIIVLLIFSSSKLNAQSFEVQQLILDWQKLTALKGILNDLYKGYEILNTGYNTIKDISERNFNLHKAFLDGLLLVSPAVRNYKHVLDIIDYQSRLVSEYKAAYNRFKKDNHFTAEELIYIGQVYGNLFSESLTDLDNLVNILTAGKLRMSDTERLAGIDGVYNQSKEKLLFLRSFNSSTTVLAVQRATEANDVATLQNLYGLK